MYAPNKEYNLLELLHKADGGDLDAMSDCVSLLAAHGYISDPKDYEIQERYASYLETLANSGRSWADIMLGDAYKDGTGVDRDPQKAIECYQKAAESGISFGNECIGLMYYYGDVIPQNYQAAYEYFTKESKKKSFCTLYALGEMFRCGRYVERDEGRACEYYKMIVYSDESYVTLDDYYWRACYRLGYALLHGAGVEKDLETASTVLSEALRLYRKRSHDAEEDKELTYEMLMNAWIELSMAQGLL